MRERVAAQQQQQQAWAQITTENHANAATRGMQLALANNPSLHQNAIDMPQSEETAVLANAKSFMSTFHAESGNKEHLDQMRADLGPPSSLTMVDGQAADCRQIGTKGTSIRINTNTLDKSVARTQNVDAGLRVSVLNKNKNKKPKASKQDLTSSQRFGAAIVSTQRHNPASTVRPLPQAMRPEEQQGGPNPCPLVTGLPQVAPVTPAAAASNQGHQFAAALAAPASA